MSQAKPVGRRMYSGVYRSYDFRGRMCKWSRVTSCQPGENIFHITTVRSVSILGGSPKVGAIQANIDVKEPSGVHQFSYRIQLLAH